MPDFRDILSKPIESVEKPRALPAGTYHGRIDKYALGESREKKTPQCDVFLTILAPGDDVPAEMLEGVKYQGKTVRKTYYLTDDSLYRFRELLESIHGDEAKGRTLHELLPGLVQSNVIMEVTQRPNDREPGSFFNDVGKVLKSA